MAIRPKFVTEDVCNAKMDDLKDIKSDIKGVNKKLDNHLLHLVEDMALMKGCLKGIKNNMTILTDNCTKDNDKNKNNKVDKDVIMKVLGIITLLIAIILIILSKGNPTVLLDMMNGA